MWFRVPARVTLPGRALLKKEVSPDGSISQVGDGKKHRGRKVKMIHFIPKEYATDTIDFFRNQTRVKALTELIFSPREPKDTPATRLDYETEVNAFEDALKERKQVYSRHEKRADELCFKAIRELPPDLYREAIRSNVTPFPKGLMFHARYNSQLFQSLSQDELVQLQTFENLSHTRFPHSEVKRRSPHLFIVAEDSIPSRQQELALSKAASKSKTTAVKAKLSK